MHDRDRGLWVVAFAERDVRVFVALLFKFFLEYVLWYVPPYIIAFARHVGMAIETAFGSHAEIREGMELFTTI